MDYQLFYTAAAGFEAARQVLVLPDDHRSRRLHGHSFLTKLRASLPADWAPFRGAEIGELTRRLEMATVQLDYRLLNDILQQPTDENLARWIAEKIDLPGIEQIGIQSTLHEGVDLDSRSQAHVWRRYLFQAAHRLPNVPPGHKCGRMHGHGFEVILHANQNIGGRDLGVDYDHLDACWLPLFDQLHLACLNDLPGLDNPTSELVASWIWAKLKPTLPELSWVTVYETGTSGAHFDGSDYHIWKEMTLDSAVHLKLAPVEDRRRSVHGHTFTLRLHLSAPLDAVMGWTLDFGDVKEFFAPIYARIDHQPLFELPGIEDADTASILRWIRREAAPTIPGLHRIDLYETRGCGAILSWGDRSPALPI